MSFPLAAKHWQVVVTSRLCPQLRIRPDLLLASRIRTAPPIRIAQIGRFQSTTSSSDFPAKGTRTRILGIATQAAAGAALSLLVGVGSYFYKNKHSNNANSTEKAPIPTDTLQRQNGAALISQQDAKSIQGSGISETSPMRLKMESFIKEKQKEIVQVLEKIDGKKFRIDTWERPGHGGGGISCVLQEGNVFEKAGVNVSVVYGKLPRSAILKMRADHKNLDPTVESLDFFATGISMVLHPHNPMAPTVHLNYRYFETMNEDGTPQSWWFGGGTDLTPSYLFDEDTIYFHQAIKEACDRHDKDYYPKFKKWCDEYFFLKHRGETRGVGGIFFDDLDEKDPENLFAFIKDCLNAFIPSYIPILKRRKDMSYTADEKEWQQLRRGRYVEFNLVHDRGTHFGLNTPNARVESILISLPLTAAWKYMHAPMPGSREERLVEVLKKPVDWV